MAENVNTLSVKQLKNFLTLRGIDPSTVGVEKTNLKARVRNIMASEASSSSPGAVAASAPSSSSSSSSSSLPLAAAPSSSSVPSSGHAAAGAPSSSSSSELASAGKKEKNKMSTLGIQVDPKFLSMSHPQVKVLYLGEEHENVKCSLANFNTLMDFINKNRLYASELLLASEGRGLNPCYEVLQETIIKPRLPKFGEPVYISEYSSNTFDADEALLTFILDVEVALGIANETKGVPLTTPSGEPISAAWFHSHFRRPNGEGHGPLLAEAGVEELAKRFFVLATLKRKEDVMATLEKIGTALLTFFQSSPSQQWLAETVLAPAVETISLYQQASATKGADMNEINQKLFESLKNIIRLINASRDVDFVDKILEEVSKNKKIKGVVIIRGDVHMLITVKLLSTVPWIQIDSKSKSYSGRTFGGSRKHRKTRSKHHKKSKRSMRRRR